MIVRSRFRQVRGPSGPGATTVAKCYRQLHSIMRIAVGVEIIKSNPCRIRGACIEPESIRDIHERVIGSFDDARFSIGVDATHVHAALGEQRKMIRVQSEIAAAVVALTDASAVSLIPLQRLQPLKGRWKVCVTDVVSHG